MSIPEKSEIHQNFHTYPPEIKDAIAIIAPALLGAHKELQTPGYYINGENPGEFWEKLNSYCEELVAKDQKKGTKNALDVAITLLQCPINLKSAKDPEKLRHWIQATGIYILTYPGMRDLLTREVDQKDSLIYPHIKQALVFDTSGFKEESDNYAEPRTYNRFAAVAVGINLRNSKPGTKSHELFQMANVLRNDPSYEEQIKEFYWVIPDCQDTVRLIYADQPKAWIIPPVSILSIK